MAALLADGKPHSRQELHKLLHDELSGMGAVSRQVCEVRKAAREQGGEIICQLLNGRICYRHIRDAKPA